jgi:hypothetical protein
MDFVVPDQIIDRTKDFRPFTFFEKGVVGHVGFADPFDARLAEVVKRCAHSMEGEGVVLHEKGTLICMGMHPSTLIACGSYQALKCCAQRARSSLHEPSRTSTEVGEAPSSICRSCPKRNSPGRLRCLTR